MTSAPSTTDIEIRLLLEAIYLRFHYDFRAYSGASLERRIGIALERTRCASVSELQEKLLRAPETFADVVGALTVQVSDMFRDAQYFRHFRERIVPELGTYPSLRLWVAGCSSGEEAYSFAILLREEGLLDRSLIYATDINEDALARAKEGVYPLDRVQVFTENHARAGGTTSLSSYYQAAYGAAIFERSLRERIVFSDHSLATDSVFAEMHVVSCRNVFIYFNRELQGRAAALFRDALTRRGFLGLGASESLQFVPGGHAFEEIERDCTWYRRR